MYAGSTEAKKDGYKVHMDTGEGRLSSFTAQVLVINSVKKTRRLLRKSLPEIRPKSRRKIIQPDFNTPVFKKNV